jgi:hypothetical protein
MRTHRPATQKPAHGFREAIIAKTLDLFKAAFGKIGVIAIADHARDELDPVVFLDLAVAAKAAISRRRRSRASL